MTLGTSPTTTYAIRAWRLLDRPPNERWVDWAVRLLTEGADTPALRMVAGLRGSFDYFEATKLVDRALVELAIPVVDKDAAVEAYAAELVEGLLPRSEFVEQALGELFQLCVETGYPRSLMPFYLLRCARDDLRVREVQFYWDGADRSNIDAIIHGEAQRWLDEHKRAA